MNFKKTALAAAVGTTLAVSGVATSVAQADGHKVQLYGRINNAYNMKEVDYSDATKAAGDGGGSLGDSDEDSTNVSTIGSRVGIKASAPIDDNTTAFARFEWSASSDDETGSFGDTRIGEVGVSGDFGTAKVGNMWSTFYNMVGTHLDPTVTLGAVLYSTVADLPYRTSNAIQYSNSFGAVNVSAEMRMNDEDDPDDVPNGETEKIGESDGTAFGASTVVFDNLLLAVAVDSQDGVGLAGDEDRTGFAAKWSQDNWWASVSLGETDIEDYGIATHTQFHVGMDFGNQWTGFVGVGVVELEADVGSDPDDAEATTINLTKRFGNSGFRVYYEGLIADDVFSDPDVYDHTQHILGARIDF